MATLNENVERYSNYDSDLRELIVDNGGTIPTNTPCEDLLTIIESLMGGGVDTEYLKAVIERPSSPTSIVIPDGTSQISSYLFYGFYGLTSITIPNSVTMIQENAFCYSGLTSLNLPNSVNYVGDSAFRNCQQMTTAYCNAKTIGSLAFNLCSSLVTFILGDNVEILGDRMAYYCGNLKTVTIPASVTEIRNAVNYSPFEGCSNLEFVTIKNGFNCNRLSLSSSTKYSASTIVSWLNALADRTGETAYTLTIGSNNLAKLTAEQIAIATNKNWNLA